MGIWDIWRVLRGPGMGPGCDYLRGWKNCSCSSNRASLLKKAKIGFGLQLVLESELPALHKLRSELFSVGLMLSPKP